MSHTYIQGFNAFLNNISSLLDRIPPQERQYYPSPNFIQQKIYDALLPANQAAVQASYLLNLLLLQLLFQFRLT